MRRFVRESLIITGVTPASELKRVSNKDNTPELSHTPIFPKAMHEISKILNTGLDRETLAILVNLCEAGVNPEALALGR